MSVVIMIDNNSSYNVSRLYLIMRKEDYKDEQTDDSDGKGNNKNNLDKNNEI